MRKQRFKFKISHYRHSGKLIPHNHTSHGSLAIILLITGMALAFSHHSVIADNTITVTATVPAEIPENAPTINEPVNNEVFETIPIWVRGNCDEDFVVKVYRNQVFAGSDQCMGGEYSLQIDLFKGKNELVAEQVNIFNQPGPSSDVVTVFYEPIEPEEPAVPPDPSRPHLPVGPPADPDIKQLVVVTDQDYFGTAAGQRLKLPLEIVGGIEPYAVSVNWGDGNSELISRSSDGRFVLEKLFREPGVYRIVVQVVDVDGREAYLSIVAIVQGETVVTPVLRSDWLVPAFWLVYVVGILAVTIFWMGERYELWQLRRHGELKNA